MNKNIIYLISSILVVIALSGCQEDASNVVSIPDKVFLESDVVEFANVSFEKLIDRDGLVYEATLTWLFHNIAGKVIDVGIDIEIFDENDKLIYQDSKMITEMPVDWTEHYSPFNTISLKGEDAQKADHVYMRVFQV